MEAIESILMGVALGMPRVLAACFLLPVFGRRNMSAFLRVAVALAFSLPIMPLTIAQVHSAALDNVGMTVLILKETVLGLLMGLAVAVPFWAAEAIGFVVDNQRGAATGSMVNPMTGDEASPLANLISQAYIVLFLVMGGLTLLLDVIYQSYAMWPVTAAWPQFDARFGEHALGLLDSLIRTTILLAAPIMIAMLLAELALAIVSLFAPQMQVFFLAMPIKSGVALFVLVIYFSTLLHYLGQGITTIPEISGTLAKLLR